MLPEIVDDGVNGLIINDTPENLAEAMVKLAGDGELREKMGTEARRKAVSSFSRSMQGEKVEALYTMLMRGSNGAL